MRLAPASQVRTWCGGCGGSAGGGGCIIALDMPIAAGPNMAPLALLPGAPPRNMGDVVGAGHRCWTAIHCAMYICRPARCPCDW
jgi:hypothetical protein